MSLGKWCIAHLILLLFKDMTYELKTMFRAVVRLCLDVMRHIIL